MASKKEYLKSQVQTAMSVRQRVYKDAYNPEKLKHLYKEQVQNVVNTAFGILTAVEKEKLLSFKEKQKKAETDRHGKSDRFFPLDDGDLKDF